MNEKAMPNAVWGEPKTHMAAVVAALKTVYPTAVCALESGNDPYRLLVMGRLSAQCTDARVNIVCRELFARYPTAADLAAADLPEVEAIVRPCGLFRVKAQNIVDASRMLVSEYGGVMPSDMEELLRFPGVGRKIANLLRGDLFGLPAIVADTHCIRICGRLGFYPEKEKDPVKVERILSAVTEPAEQSDLCHRLVQFGRDVCMARAPRCEGCPLSALCAAQNAGGAG
ncbi:MAG: endonuclease III [Eubacteriales bacterium]|nr:endonuclease III [Eubacteriales bacterium]